MVEIKLRFDNERGLYWPLHSDDKPLYRHIMGGGSAHNISEIIYNRPVFEAHGAVTLIPHRFDYDTP